MFKSMTDFSHSLSLEPTAVGAGQFRCRGSRRESAVAQLTSEVIRQRFFQELFTGFLKGLLPSSTRSNKATSGLPFFFKAAS